MWVRSLDGQQVANLKLCQELFAEESEDYEGKFVVCATAGHCPVELGVFDSMEEATLTIAKICSALELGEAVTFLDLT